MSAVLPPPTALSVAGSDPSGGAGLQADLKVFTTLGVYGAACVTLLTVQNTQGVAAVHPLEPDLVVAQADAVVSDLDLGAIKFGALGSAALVEAMAAWAATRREALVIDPVMISKHGHPLLDDDAVETFRTQLLPRASVLTPNRFEAARLLDRDPQGMDSREALLSAAADLRDLGAAHVLLKAPHPEDPKQRLDLHAGPYGTRELPHPAHDRPNLHGSGCVLAAALTAHLAIGHPTEAAIDAAIRFASHAIRNGPALGKGVPPTDMLPGER